MKTFSVLALALAFSTSVFAADNARIKPTTLKKPIARETKTTVLTTSASSSSSSLDSEAEGNLTASLGAVDGDLIFGLGYQLEFPTVIQGDRFAFGGQTGFYYSTSNQIVFGVKTDTKAWAIPILFTGKYLFDNSIEFMKPYVAVGLGFSIDHVRTTVNTAGVIAKDSDTTIHFAMLVRPGLTFGATQRWFAEVPIGVLLTEFAVLPTVGYHF